MPDQMSAGGQTLVLNGLGVSLLSAMLDRWIDGFLDRWLATDTRAH